MVRLITLATTNGNQIIVTETTTISTTTIGASSVSSTAHASPSGEAFHYRNHAVFYPVVSDSMPSLIVDLFHAYYDARRNKRQKETSLQFELAYESHLMHLFDALQDRTYTPRVSKAFIIHDPVQREIFAGNFRDRVVHHLIYNYIYDIFDTWFISDSYSCRIGKGTHYGIQRVDHFIRSCSANYTCDCYILKLDIKGFFMSIDKHILRSFIDQRMSQQKAKRAGSIGSAIGNGNEQGAPPYDYEWLMRLIHTTLFHDPKVDADIRGKHTDRDGLPDDKSLFHCAPDIGLPIGNLTSQLFANIYLHPLDHFIKRTLHCRYYGRYVDDFVIVHESKEYLVSCLDRIKNFLSETLHLTLHPHKIYLQHYTKGVKFLGASIKPHRIYLHRRAVGNVKKKIHGWRSLAGQSPADTPEFTRTELNQKISVINSYFGMLSHYASYNLRKKLYRAIPSHIAAHISQRHAYTKITPSRRILKRKELRTFISHYKHLYHALPRTSRL